MKKTTSAIIAKFFEEKPELKYLKDAMKKAILMLSEIKIENKIMVCGNGGSCADSEHISGELLKSFMLKRKISQNLRNKLVAKYGESGETLSDNLQQGIKCIPLTSFSAVSTAFANDCNSDYIYAQLVNALGLENDVLIAISTSGNSKNVLYAAQLAKVLGIKVIALTGKAGGKLKQYADILINAPSDVVYKIQEYHLPIYHLLCLGVENEVFDE